MTQNNVSDIPTARAAMYDAIITVGLKRVQEHCKTSLSSAINRNRLYLEGKCSCIACVIRGLFFRESWVVSGWFSHFKITVVWGSNLSVDLFFCLSNFQLSQAAVLIGPEGMLPYIFLYSFLFLFLPHLYPPIEAAPERTASVSMVSSIKWFPVILLLTTVLMTLFHIRINT